MTETRERRGYVAIIGLLLLAFSYLDATAAEFLPVDLTLVTAGVVGLTVYLRVLGEGFRAPRGLGVVLLLWVTFLIGVPGTPWDEYTSSKLKALFTLALLCALGGLYLLRSMAARVWWLKLNVALGLIVAGLAYLFPGDDAGSGRLAIEGGSAISAGRGAGAAVVVLLVVALYRRRLRALTVLATTGLALIMVATGSRGPLVAAVAAVLVAALVPTKGRFKRALIGVAAIGMTGYLAVRTELVAERVTTLGQSGENRLLFWEIAWETAAAHPFGVGWGGLRGYLPALRDYPHNVLLETLAEASWVAGIALVAALWICWRRQRRAARTGVVEVAMLGLFVFHLLNAMVSSDVPGNRGLWVSVGAALVVGLRDRVVDREVALDDTLPSRISTFP